MAKLTIKEPVMSNLKYTGTVKQGVTTTPEKTYKKILHSFFKKKLKEKSKIGKYSFLGFGKKNNIYSSDNVGVSFAILHTNNGYFNSATKRYAVLLTKNTKNLWNIPIFTMSKEKFDNLDDMLDAIYEKSVPIMKRLYDINQIKENEVHIVKISDKKRDRYVFILTPESWKGDAQAVRAPLNSKYNEMNWFDQRSYIDDPEYWKDSQFGDKTAITIRYINAFFDSRVSVASGMGIGY